MRFLLWKTPVSASPYCASRRRPAPGSICPLRSHVTNVCVLSGRCGRSAHHYWTRPKGTRTYCYMVCRVASGWHGRDVRATPNPANELRRIFELFSGGPIVAMTISGAWLLRGRYGSRSVAGRVSAFRVGQAQRPVLEPSVQFRPDTAHPFV